MLHSEAGYIEQVRKARSIKPLATHGRTISWVNRCLPLVANVSATSVVGSELAAQGAPECRDFG
jgi:hypothetical protein